MHSHESKCQPSTDVGYDALLNLIHAKGHMTIHEHYRRHKDYRVIV